jgi:hypothetical protein
MAIDYAYFGSGFCVVSCVGWRKEQKLPSMLGVPAAIGAK